jgi:RHS repeat-associated protein
MFVLAKAAGCSIEQYTESGGRLSKLSAEEGSAPGECKNPAAIAVDKHDDLWIADTGNSRLDEFNENGTFLKSVGEKGTGPGKLEQPTSIAIDAHGDIFAGDYKNERVEEYNEKGEYVREFGSTKELPLGKPLALTIDAHGNILVASSNDRVEVFNGEGVYETKFGQQGSGTGQFEFADPSGIAALPNGDVWVTDSLGYKLEKWDAPSQASGNPGAHDTRAVYYSVAANSEYKECGGHPEYANLPCITAPGAQPGTSGTPNLPETKYTSYNVYDEPLASTETIGAATRTNEATYDILGRPLSKTVISSAGEALPPVSYEYEAETGFLTTETTRAEGKKDRITNAYDTLGQLTSYTDAAGTTSTYEYDVDGRVKKTNDGKGTQTFTYSTTSGLPTELVDSSAEGMKFSATYDPEGNMLTEGYPNGMTASYTYDPTGTPTKLEYNKTTHCSEKCTWFSDVVVPSIHGETLSQSSTLSKEEYTFDAAGRLIQSQTTPAGKGCTTRDYVFDEDTNRTSLSTYEPDSSGECATEAGTSETHSYNTADQLTDTGVKYNELADISALPAADAGGAELKSSYYGDGQAQSQTQNEQTIGYDLDPDRRPYETISTGKPVDSTVTSHYAGPGNTPSWTTNLTGETKRNIPGIDGGLAAIQNGTEAPVLQLTNLHGDIIATAYKSETATELASKADTSEYGVPTNSLPAKYSWLGELEIPTELPSGVTAMGVRSYIPQLGRFLQPDPIPGGSANAYNYTYGNPLNTSDPTGDYTATITHADEEYSDKLADDYTTEREGEIRAAEEAKRAAEEAAAREAAEQTAAEAAWYAETAGGPEYAGEEEWEEWWEEEGEYEYISDHHSGTQGSEEAHVEPAILVQPLMSEAQAGEDGHAEPGTVPLCESGATSSCSQDTGGVGHSHGEKLVRALEHDGSNQGSVCDGVATLMYFVPGLGEVRGVAGLLFLGAC